MKNNIWNNLLTIQCWWNDWCSLPTKYCGKGGMVLHCKPALYLASSERVIIPRCVMSTNEVIDINLLSQLEVIPPSSSLSPRTYFFPIIPLSFTKGSLKHMGGQGNQKWLHCSVVVLLSGLTQIVGLFSRYVWFQSLFNRTPFNWTKLAIHICLW